MQGVRIVRIMPQKRRCNEKGFFEIVKACLLGMLFLSVGLYLGTMNERKEHEVGDMQYESY